MASTTISSARRFLNNLSSQQGKELMESLGQLLEVLEQKNDPEVSEIEMCHSICETIKHIKLMENDCRSYIHETVQCQSAGNKLDELKSKQINVNGYLFR